jgi:methyl-accepting chemotaxis protein
MFKYLSVKWKLAIGFSAVVALFIVTLLVIWASLTSLSQGVREANDTSLPLVLAVDQMDLSRSEVQQFLTDVSATHDTTSFKDADVAAKSFQSSVDQVKRLFTKSGDTGNLKEIAAIEARFNTFYSSGKVMAQAYVSNGIDAGNLLMKGTGTVPGFDKASNELSVQLTKFRERQISDATQTTQSALHDANAISVTMLVGGSVATVFAAIFAVLIVRGITAH